VAGISSLVLEGSDNRAHLALGDNNPSSNYSGGGLFDFLEISDFDNLPNASFTGSITATTLTVTGSPTGRALAVGQIIAGAGIPVGTNITALGTGSGGAGTYTISASLTVSSEAMTAGWPPPIFKVNRTGYVGGTYTTQTALTIGNSVGGNADGLWTWLGYPGAPTTYAFEIDPTNGFAAANNRLLIGNAGNLAITPVVGLDDLGHAVFGNVTSGRASVATYLINTLESTANQVRLINNGVGEVGIQINNTPVRLDFVDLDHSNIVPLSIALNDSGTVTAGNLVDNGTGIFTGNVGIGTTTPYSKLTIWGSDTASSTAAFTIANSASTTEFQIFDGGNAQLAGTLTQNSDQRLKTNITSLGASSSLAAIDALNPVTFNWIDPTEGTTPQLGFIAQQVQQLFPALISTTSPTPLTPGGTLGLNYIGLISPIVSAIQALSAEVTSLEATVAGFATSFHTQQLCVGATCINEQQLASLLALEQQGQVQISAPTPPVISGTSTPPSINIQGANPATINVGDTYTDLGALVTDNQGHNLGYKTFLDGVLVSNIVIDTTLVATDTIDYVATDTWGNTATSTRTVIVGSVASSSTQ
jgi:hypothetical protein